MIDWVSAVLPYPHQGTIHGGALVFITPKGEESAPIPQLNQVRGSFDARCAIMSDRQGAGQRIYVSGSPKFLQGHNLFGVDNPATLAALLARKALEALGHRVDEVTFAGWKRGRGVKLTRVDVTYMLDVGNETNAGAFLEAIAEQTNMRYRGRGENRNGTIYFGKHSRRWSLKLYRKFVELHSKKKAHQLPPSIDHHQDLMQYACGTVRAELTLRSLELKRLCLARADAWKDETAQTTWASAMKTLEISGNVRLEEKVIDSLPRSVRATYALWRDGRNVPAMLPRATYYRHRKALMPYGVDLGARPVAPGAPRVVPFIRVIEARPKTIPQWAYNTPLLAA